MINAISNLSSFFSRRLVGWNFSCVRCPRRVELVPASLRTARPIWCQLHLTEISAETTYMNSLTEVEQKKLKEFGMNYAFDMNLFCL